MSLVHQRQRIICALQVHLIVPNAQYVHHQQPIHTIANICAIHQEGSWESLQSTTARRQHHKYPIFLCGSLPPEIPHPHPRHPDTHKNLLFVGKFILKSEFSVSSTPYNYQHPHSHHDEQKALPPEHHSSSGPSTVEKTSSSRWGLEYCSCDMLLTQSFDI